MTTWRECLISSEGIRSGELFQFRNLCVKAFSRPLPHTFIEECGTPPTTNKIEKAGQLGKFPKEAAVFSEAVFGNDQVKFWVSPVAVQLLEKNGVDLSRWQAKESGPPKRSEVALLAGHFQLAWELLK